MLNITVVLIVSSEINCCRIVYVACKLWIQKLESSNFDAVIDHNCKDAGIENNNR